MPHVIDIHMIKPLMIRQLGDKDSECWVVVESYEKDGDGEHIDLNFVESTKRSSSPVNFRINDICKIEISED